MRACWCAVHTYGCGRCEQTSADDHGNCTGCVWRGTSSPAPVGILTSWAGARAACRVAGGGVRRWPTRGGGRFCVPPRGGRKVHGAGCQHDGSFRRNWELKRALTSRGVSVMMPLWEGRNVQGLLRTGGGRPHAGCWPGEALSC